MFKKIFAAAAVTVTALLTVPTAACAVDYTQGPACHFDTAVAHAGDTVTLTCTPGTWDPQETVEWTSTGGGGTSVMLPGSQGSVSGAHFEKQSNADGSDTLAVGLPSDADGVYSFTGVGRTSGHVYPVSITVAPTDSLVTVSSVAFLKLVDGWLSRGSAPASWSRRRDASGRSSP